ncbi:MAG: serine hydrolase domain-containing protein [Candidatus Hydrogenedentota bacterium]
MLIRVQSFFILMVFLPVVSSHAESAIALDAQAVLDAKRAEYTLAGVTAAVAIDFELVWEGGVGMRDREQSIPTEVTMLHRVASITKSMTAVAIMQLVESGKIDLDASLRTYLPDYPESDRGTIRIRHLLAHTSGVRHYRGDENRPFDHYDTLADALAVFQGRRIAFEPGDRYLYTTYGYTILGAVIESATGMSYGEYMKEFVWTPSGMQSTSLEMHGAQDPNQSKLYRKNDAGEIEEDDYTDLSIKYPGGGLVSTSGDLVRFAIAFESGNLVSAGSRIAMFEIPLVSKPRRVPYALGWMVWDSETYGTYLHNDGGQSGTSTYLVILPEQKIAVAVMSNLSSEGRAVRDIAFSLVDLALARQE